MKYNTVIFDMDGTLLNTIGDLAWSLNETLSHFGMPPKTIAEVTKMVGDGSLMLVKRAVPENTDEETVKKIFAEFKETYRTHLAVFTKPYPGIMDLLDKLGKRGYKIAIVSNKPDKALKELNDIYFGGRIAVAVGDRDGARTKPAPDLVNIALKELKSDIRETVYIGDSEVDIKTAKNCGMDCISVDWGFRSRETLIEKGAANIAGTADDIIKFMGENK